MLYNNFFRTLFGLNKKTIWSFTILILKKGLTCNILESIALKSSFESARLVCKRKTPTPLGSFSSWAEIRTLWSKKIRLILEKTRKKYFLPSELLVRHTSLAKVSCWARRVECLWFEKPSGIQNLKFFYYFQFYKNSMLPIPSPRSFIRRIPRPRSEYCWFVLSN